MSFIIGNSVDYEDGKWISYFFITFSELPLFTLSIKMKFVVSHMLLIGDHVDELSSNFEQIVIPGLTVVCLIIRTANL